MYCPISPVWAMTCLGALLVALYASWCKACRAQSTSVAAKSQINEKFNNSSTTPLRVNVAPGENNINIDLKSDGTGTVK